MTLCVCGQMLKHFQRITPDEALAQHTRNLQASSAAAAQERAERDREQLLHRGPGRPKKELKLIRQKKQCFTSLTAKIIGAIFVQCKSG
jgi:hypothetical protein